MTRWRTAVIGALLFAAFLVVLAPASLVRQLLPAGGQIDLLQTRGSLWRGSGELYIDGRPAGSLTWDHQAVTILQGALGYHVTLKGPEHRIDGQVRLGPSRWRIDVDGNLGAGFVNAWLAPYDIAISGDVQLEDVTVTVPYRWDGTGSATGDARWNGGPVSYRLAGQSHSGVLPPLAAFLGDGLEAVVYPQDGQTPLLRAQMQSNGFARIGVTRMLTGLLGNPWPGAQQDHEVVLEVEEQLF
jgi:general secretion pathway protein N